MYIFAYDLSKGLDRWRQYGWNWKVLFTSFKTWLAKSMSRVSRERCQQMLWCFSATRHRVCISIRSCKNELFGVFPGIRGFSFAYVHEHPKMFFISRLSSNSYKDHLVKQHVRAQKHVSTSIRAIKTRENCTLNHALLAFFVFMCFFWHFFCTCTWNVCCFNMVSVFLVQSFDHELRLRSRIDTIKWRNRLLVDPRCLAHCCFGLNQSKVQGIKHVQHIN